MERTQIFLSYARKDRAIAEAILAAFSKRGWAVFMDQQIASGVDWRKVVESQLEEAYAVVVVWSSHSVKSRWVAREARVGLTKDRLFPVLVEADVILPRRFKHKQATDLSDWNGDPDDPKFDRVLDLLKPLWESEKGLLKDAVVRRWPLKFKA